MLKDKRYKGVIDDLVNRLRNEVMMIEQWKKYDEWLPSQLEHYYKALALLELLENITVFYTGFGYTKCDPYNRHFNSRCESFFRAFPAS